MSTAVDKELLEQIGGEEAIHDFLEQLLAYIVLKETNGEYTISIEDIAPAISGKRFNLIALIQDGKKAFKLEML